MIAYWSAFARTADPNAAHRRTGPAWPRYWSTAQHGRQALISLQTPVRTPSGHTFSVEHRCGFWDGPAA